MGEQQEVGFAVAMHLLRAHRANDVDGQLVFQVPNPSGTLRFAQYITERSQQLLGRFGPSIVAVIQVESKTSIPDFCLPQDKADVLVLRVDSLVDQSAKSVPCGHLVACIKRV